MGKCYVLEIEQQGTQHEDSTLLYQSVWSLQAEEDGDADETNVQDDGAGDDSIDREEL